MKMFLYVLYVITVGLLVSRTEARPESNVQWKGISRLSQKEEIIPKSAVGYFDLDNVKNMELVEPNLATETHPTANEKFINVMERKIKKALGINQSEESTTAPMIAADSKPEKVNNLDPSSVLNNIILPSSKMFDMIQVMLDITTNSCPDVNKTLLLSFNKFIHTMLPLNDNASIRSGIKTVVNDHKNPLFLSLQDVWFQLNYDYLKECADYASPHTIQDRLKERQLKHDIFLTLNKHKVKTVVSQDQKRTKRDTSSFEKNESSMMEKYLFSMERVLKVVCRAKPLPQFYRPFRRQLIMDFQNFPDKEQMHSLLSSYWEIVDPVLDQIRACSYKNRV